MNESTRSSQFRSFFGSAVRDSRTELGISQEELADRAGLHRTYISDVERGARNPSLDSIQKLALALDLTVAELFEEPRDETACDEVFDILLVEDTESDVELTRRGFRKAKITNPLHVVADGEEALDFLFATGRHADRTLRALPGMVLLDLELPKIDGTEVLRRMRGNAKTREIPVIVLTGSNHEQDIAVCREFGASDYLVKPVDFQKLSKVVACLQMGWAIVRAPEMAAGTEYHSAS